jgi:hypothetical protein
MNGNPVDKWSLKMETITITLESDKFDMTIEDTARAVRHVADHIEQSGADAGEIRLMNGWGREAVVGSFIRKTL